MRNAVKEQADLIAISDADRTDITWSTDDEVEKAKWQNGVVFPSARAGRLYLSAPQKPLQFRSRGSPGTPPAA